MMEGVIGLYKALNSMFDTNKSLCKFPLCGDNWLCQIIVANLVSQTMAPIFVVVGLPLSDIQWWLSSTAQEDDPGQRKMLRFG